MQQSRYSRGSPTAPAMVDRGGRVLENRKRRSPQTSISTQSKRASGDQHSSQSGVSRIKPQLFSSLRDGGTNLPNEGQMWTSRDSPLLLRLL